MTGTATVNGRNVIVFDGVDDWMNHFANLGLNVGSVTVFVVAKETVEAAGAGVVMAYNSGNDYDQAYNFVITTSDAGNLLDAVRSYAGGAGQGKFAGAGATPIAVWAVRFSSSGLIEVWRGGVAGANGNRAERSG